MSQFTMTVTGNLTADPKLTKFSEEKYNLRMRVASSRRAFVEDKETNKSGWKEFDTMYIDVDVWGQLAINAAKSLKRGLPVICHGSLCTEEWTDSKTGVKRERTYLRALQIGIDMNKFVVGYQRMQAAHTPEGSSIPNLGIEEIRLENDYSVVDEAEIRDETGLPPEESAGLRAIGSVTAGPAQPGTSFAGAPGAADAPPTSDHDADQQLPDRELPERELLGA